VALKPTALSVSVSTIYRSIGKVLVNSVCFAGVAEIAISIHLISKPMLSGLASLGEADMDNKLPRWELDEDGTYVQYDVGGHADISNRAVIWWLCKMAMVVLVGSLAIIYVAGLIWG